MSSEKADLASDQVSLPPTYAPSEAFTESPPPAYKKSSTTAVRIAKLVCVTAFAITFLIGFFIVSHKWVQARDCNCPVQVETLRQEPLISQAGFVPLEDNSVTETKEKPSTDLKSLGQALEEELVLPEQASPLETEAEPADLQAEEQEEQVDFQNKVKLPIDLLLGDSELAGRDVQCNVEKRRQKIADGIFNEAIIVTCNDDKEEEPTPAKPFNLKKFLPPMSLLGDIMKILSNRPRTSNMDEPNRNHMAPPPMRRIPFPLPFQRPNPGQMNGPFGPMRLIPLNRPQQQFPMPEIRELPQRFPFQQLPQGFQPFRVIKKITVNPGPIPQDSQPSGSVDAISPISVFNSLPAPIAEFKHLHHPQVRIIKVPKHHMENQENREEPRLPFHPILKMLPSGRARVLRILPIHPPNAFPQQFSRNEESEQEFDRPIPRGLLPLEPRPEENQEFNDESVPEASGRSLPSPLVNFPVFKLLRLPQQQRAFPFQGQHESPFPITHMEMQERHEEHSEDYPEQNAEEQEDQQQQGTDFGPPRTHTIMESAPEPFFRDDARFQQEDEDYSLPEHQVEHQEEAQETPFQGRSVQDESLPEPQFLSSFFVPPPARFAPEGRSSPFAEINSDAEYVDQASENHQQEVPLDNHHVVLN